MSLQEDHSLTSDSALGDEQAEGHGVGSAVLVYVIGLAPAFGVLIIGGSRWIMANLNQNMMPMDQLMRMQR